MHVIGESSFCPRSLFDCNSLEANLFSSADVILSPDFMSSVHDYENIGEICKFFQTPSCSEPVLSQCKGEVVYATKAFKSRQDFICGDRFTRKGMQKLKQCVRKFHHHFSRCQQKRKDKLEEVTYSVQASSPVHPWCNLTNDYIICVYTVMAFGCTTELADEYNDIVNYSVPVVEAIYGHGCSFGHPLDILKTASSPPESTTMAVNRAAGVYSYGRKNAHGYRNSARIINYFDVVLFWICELFSSVGILSWMFRVGAR